MPAALALASLGGLAAALFLDGVGDALSSAALALPLLALLHHLPRRRLGRRAGECDKIGPSNPL